MKQSKLFELKDVIVSAFSLEKRPIDSGLTQEELDNSGIRIPNVDYTEEGLRQARDSRSLMRKLVFSTLRGRNWDDLSWGEADDLSLLSLSYVNARYYIQSKLLIPKNAEDILNLYWKDLRRLPKGPTGRWFSGFWDRCTEEQKQAISLYAELLVEIYPNSYQSSLLPWPIFEIKS